VAISANLPVLQFKYHHDITPDALYLSAAHSRVQAEQLIAVYATRTIGHKRHLHLFSSNLKKDTTFNLKQLKYKLKILNAI